MMIDVAQSHIRRPTGCLRAVLLVGASTRTGDVRGLEAQKHAEQIIFLVCAPFTSPDHFGPINQLDGFDLKLARADAISQILQNLRTLTSKRAFLVKTFMRK